MKSADNTVLIGVIKRDKDINILLSEQWYRIPEEHVPHRPFTWIAFYQTAGCRTESKCIRYYARIKNAKAVKRRLLLPDEPKHPGSEKRYIRYELGPVRRLKRKITNRTGMKVVFAFTDIPSLKKRRFLHTLLNNRPLEPAMGRLLKKAGIPAVSEYPVKSGKGVYRLDFALFCRKGAINIECDSPQSHSTSIQIKNDRKRDRYLTSRGWTVLRFTPDDIFRSPGKTIEEISDVIDLLEGQERE